MKLSRYCFLLTNKRGYYCFSTLFYSILQVDEDAFRLLQRCKEEDTDVPERCVGKGLFDALYENGLLCRSHKEEFFRFYQRCQYARQDERDLHITIVPTLNCCFACAYCFEKHKKASVINCDVLCSIIKYILKKNPDSLHITWFGGEPILAIKQIEEFSKKLDSQFHGDYSSDIITTGFPISEPVIDIIKRSHITEIQVTIDGAQENHNKVKYTKGCSDTFTHVFDNIKLITQRIPEIRCVIRVNVTKENAADIPFLHNLVKERFQGSNVWLSPSLVIDNGIACSGQLFSYDDFRNLSKEWWYNYKIPTKWIYGLEQSECAIRKPSAIVVMPDGNLCRCWEEVGNKESYVGSLNTDGTICDSENQAVFSKKLNDSDPFLNESCKECPYLPLCFGGCPIKGIKFHQKELQCTSYKNHLDEWLDIYLDYLSAT